MTEPRQRTEILDDLENARQTIRSTADLLQTAAENDGLEGLQGESVCHSMEGVYQAAERIGELLSELDSIHPSEDPANDPEPDTGRSESDAVNTASIEGETADTAAFMDHLGAVKGILDLVELVGVNPLEEVRDGTLEHVARCGQRELKNAEKEFAVLWDAYCALRPADQQRDLPKE